MKIVNAEAYTILDSTGYPTIEVRLTDEKNNTAKGAAPRGSTVGEFECMQIYNKRNTFNFDFVDDSILLFNNKIRNNIINNSYDNFREFDAHLLKLDPTPNKCNIGGNTILASSIAFCELEAMNKGLELYEIFGHKSSMFFPNMMFNLVDGTLGSKLKGIEFLIISKGGDIEKQLISAKRTFSYLERIILNSNETVSYSNQGALQMTDFAIEEILRIIKNISDGFDLGLDMAMSDRKIENSTKYNLPLLNGNYIESNDLPKIYKYWHKIFNVNYIEDGFHYNDFKGWEDLMSGYENVLIAGDDLYATNINRIEEYDYLANSVVIKPNQIGTISETIEAILLAKDTGKQTIISQRTSEIRNTIIADLAYSYGVNYVKFGGLNRNDRIDKYNRLLEIARIERNKYALRDIKW
ncbi:hypothetical protein GH131_10395 [Staphylococcus pseudintermedius]|nr:hypothetical protein [Staphylococcus pseudintermedius]